MRARAVSAGPDSVRRKRLGQYFTDRRVALLLAHLAHADLAQSVVDPMAGEGVMLVAALDAGACPERLAAVEIENSAWYGCRKMLGNPAFRDIDVKLIHGNAFAPTTGMALGLDVWDLVITNPPYVRYQRSSARDTGDTPLPNGEAIRHDLRRTIAEGITSSLYRDCLLDLVRRYSGLSDVALPSWLLCAGLVREGGRLAMVVPEAWLSRDYALPIKELLATHFEVEFVVEDSDASWFSDALVRTNLVIARRIRTGEESTGGQLHLRLHSGLANNNSLVAGLFPAKVNPESAFAKQADSWRSLHASESMDGLEVEWMNDSPGSRSCGRTGYERLHMSGRPPTLPARLQKCVANPKLVSLEAIGWRVGQGLRTGANAFFYVEVLESSSGQSLVRPDPRLWPEVLVVQNEALRPVLRKQADLGSTFIVGVERLKGRVLLLEGLARPADLDAAARAGADVSRMGLEPLANDLTAYIDHVETVNLASDEQPRLVPYLSAVKTNVRPFDPSMPERRPRFWYQLPPLADRHLPDLLVARVNHKRPRVAYNPGRRAIVDANFSTLWARDAHAADPLAVLALFAGTWATAVMEASGTVLGGGALKSEATYLRQFPVPMLFPDAQQEYARLGQILIETDDTNSVIREIDALTWKTLELTNDSATIAQVEDLAKRLVRRRSP